MNLNITLNWSTIKNEIDYETYKAAEISITDVVAKGEAKSDNTNADIDFCLTKIESAVGNLEEIMHKHFLTVTVDSINNNITRSNRTWSLNLFYPDSSRRRINMQSLRSMCHHYVAAYVLAEWSKLATPTLTPGYQERMTSEIEAIDRLVNRKEAPTLLAEDTSTKLDTTIDGLTATAQAIQVASSQTASAEVTITRTETADGLIPAFNFTFRIPKGDKGDRGYTGAQGVQGAQGAQGIPGTVDEAALYSRMDTAIKRECNALGMDFSKLQDQINSNTAAINENKKQLNNQLYMIQNNDGKQTAALSQIKNWMHFSEITGTNGYTSLQDMIEKISGSTASSTPSQGTGTGDATKTWVNDNFLTKADFAKIFKVMKGSGEGTFSDYDSIAALKNFYSLGGVSAYGIGSTGTASSSGSSFTPNTAVTQLNSFSASNSGYLYWDNTAGSWTLKTSAGGSGLTEGSIADELNKVIKTGNNKIGFLRYVNGAWTMQQSGTLGISLFGANVDLPVNEKKYLCCQNGTWSFESAPQSSGNPSSGGTVTSVGITLPEGLELQSGSTTPITSSGTFAIQCKLKYKIPQTSELLTQTQITDLTTLNSNKSNWNTVYSWYNGLDTEVRNIKKTDVDKWNGYNTKFNYYLPLTGGTMTGNIKFPITQNGIMFGNTLLIQGYTSTTNGTKLDYLLVGDKTYQTNVNGVRIAFSAQGHNVGKMIWDNDANCPKWSIGDDSASNGSAYFWWDKDNKAFCFNGNLYATGGISAYGSATAGTLESMTLTKTLTAKDIVSSNKITAKDVEISNSLKVGDSGMTSDAKIHTSGIATAWIRTQSGAIGTDGTAISSIKYDSTNNKVIIKFSVNDAPVTRYITLSNS